LGITNIFTFDAKLQITNSKQGHDDQNSKTRHPCRGMIYIADSTSKQVPIDQNIYEKKKTDEKLHWITGKLLRLTFAKRKGAGVVWYSHVDR